MQAGKRRSGIPINGNIGYFLGTVRFFSSRRNEQDKVGSRIRLIYQEVNREANIKHPAIHSFKEKKKTPQKDLSSIFLRVPSSFSEDSHRSVQAGRVEKGVQSKKRSLSEGRKSYLYRLTGCLLQVAVNHVLHVDTVPIVVAIVVRIVRVPGDRSHHFSLLVRYGDLRPRQDGDVRLPSPSVAGAGAGAAAGGAIIKVFHAQIECTIGHGFTVRLHFVDDAHLLTLLQRRRAE